MKYKIESVGSAFNDKGMADLSNRFNHRAKEGWYLHSVFSIEKKGCLGQSEGMTYLAVYYSDE